MEKKPDNPVITGQQIGLLGGPLYTTYKVLSAIRYGEKSGKKVVYWLETNDADFNEINRIDYIDKNNTLQTLRWDIDSGGYSTGQIIIDDKLINILNIFFNTVTETEFTNSLKDIVFSCYRIGRKLGKSSLMLAEKLFGKYNIRIFDPSIRDFREFTKPILLKEAESTKISKQCNLFFIENKKRKTVFKSEGSFKSREGKTLDLNEFDLVPNVKTRNICQDAYFNTDTYIAGPGEIAYIKELDKFYKKHNVKKPKVKKRMSVKLIEPKSARLLKKTGLSLDDILNTEKSNLSKLLLSTTHGFDIKNLSSKALQLTDAYLDQLENLEINFGRLKKQLVNKIKNILGKKRAELKKEIKNKIQSAEELHDRVIPYGKKQERVFNIFYYMNLYGGLGFIDFLYDNHSFEEIILEIKND